MHSQGTFGSGLALGAPGCRVSTLTLSPPTPEDVGSGSVEEVGERFGPDGPVT